MKPQAAFRLALLVLSWVIHASAQSWVWQNPSPQGNNIQAVQIVDSNTIVCVGDSGAFLKSTDSGVSWSVQHFLGGTSPSLRGVWFIDSNIGMVVGQEGTILRTLDGGSIWSVLSSPTSEFLHDVWFLDANIGTIVGGLGTILQTTNGGTTWVTRVSGTTSSLFGISFTDANTGTVVGGGGNVLRTADGGATWTSRNTGTTNALYDVSFTDSNTGTVVGAGGIILRTTNGGSTWNSQSSGTTETLLGVSFADENNGLAAGLLEDILRTTDGGSTWKKREGIPQSFYLPTFLDVSFQRTHVGVCVGNAGIICQTTDAGKSWLELSSGHTTPAAIVGMTFVNAEVGIGVGHSGGSVHIPNVFRTTDGGATWSIQFLGGNINSVAFSDFERATAVGAYGDYGFIQQTTDQGVTWSRSQFQYTNYFMNEVHYADSINGMAVGNSGLIFRTSDGGTTWQGLQSGTSIHLKGIHVIDANTAIAVGGDAQAPIILRTTDGGTIWQNVPILIRSGLNAVAFIGSSIGVAVGSGGIIIRTNDGGISWIPQVSNTINNLTDVKFDRDGSVGYALGGVILRTTDTGITWTVDQSPGTGSAVSTTGDSGWTIGGSSGTILHKEESLILSSPLAQFGVCYGTTGSADQSNPGALITIDPTTGVGTLVGPTGINGDNGPSVPTLAITSKGEMYALSAGTSSGLYSINASTGTGTFIATTGLSSPDALAFDANDVLYAVANSNNLYTVDKTSGKTTIIGPTGFDPKALSYDPTTGAMYGSSTDDQIYIIDVKTGKSTLVGNTGLGGPTHALRFDQNGNLFGTKGNASNPYTLISIDKATGHGSTIGSIGFEGVLGLASRVLSMPVGAPVTVKVEIDSLLKFVPADGDTFPYSLTFTNRTSQAQTIDWWTKVIRPKGNPVDPLSGPGVLALNPFQSVVIDTPTIPVPFDAWSGEYTLVAFVGSYQVDTLHSDTTTFVKLPAIPCSDISLFQARCRPGGIVQARIILTDSIHTGDPVEFTIDDVGYESTVARNGRALVSLPGFNPGSHTVELTEPPDCFDPIAVTCPAGLAKDGDGFWEGDESWEIPATTILLENYPDPFNPSTTIRYALSEDAHVTLKVYNMLGQVVATLVDENQLAGYREVLWNGSNDFGLKVASGIYIYRMTAGSFAATKRMLLLK